MVKLFSRNACKAKNPAFCRYHGVKEPMTKEKLLDRAVAAESHLIRERQHPVPDLGLVNVYRKEIQNSFLTIAAIQANKYGIDTVEFDGISGRLGMKVDKKMIEDWQKIRTAEEEVYLANLRAQIFTNPHERIVAEKGAPRVAAHKAAIENKYPTLKFMPSLHDDGPLTEKMWTRYEVYASDRELDKHEKLVAFAEKNNLEVIVAKDKDTIMGAVLLPFSWKDYGMTKDEYQRVRNDAGYEKRHIQYSDAKNLLRSGLSVSSLAGGRTEKQPKVKG